jgi:hypothetical protein
MAEIMPRSRVLAFASCSFVDDKGTPLSVTMRPATVVLRYGKPAKFLPISGTILGPYSDLVDIRFDHDPSWVSRGHFIDRVHPIAP